MTSADSASLEAAFGARLREVRIAEGRSQAEVAELANISRGAVSNLESGAGSSLSTVIKVLRALGRSDWLLTLDPPEAVFNPLDLLRREGADGRRGPRRVKRARSAAEEPAAHAL